MLLYDVPYKEQCARKKSIDNQRILKGAGSKLFGYDTNSILF